MTRRKRKKRRRLSRRRRDLFRTSILTPAAICGEWLAADGIRGGWKGAREEKKEGDRGKYSFLFFFFFLFFFLYSPSNS